LLLSDETACSAALILVFETKSSVHKADPSSSKLSHSCTSCQHQFLLLAMFVQKLCSLWVSGCRTGYSCLEHVCSYFSLATVRVGNKTRLCRYRPFVLPVRRFI